MLSMTRTNEDDDDLVIYKNNPYILVGEHILYWQNIDRGMEYFSQIYYILFDHRFSKLFLIHF